MTVESRLAVLPKLIDHTLLKPEAKLSEIEQLCAEAKQYQFHAVCVNPVWVSVAFEALRGSDIKVVSVAGFPLGATRTDLKVAEAPPGERGDTAQGGSKLATLETGAQISVPLFVNTGDVVRVNTETGMYVERVEKAKE